MASSSLPSAPPTEKRDELLRRFVEASLRARIVAMVNRADSERELGELITAELCEAFEAEIAFVFAGGEDGACDLVGAYGLQPREAFDLPGHELCRRGLLTATEPELHRGDDLLGLGIRHLAVVPFGPGAGVVGVARLHQQRFDEAEVALLEAIAASTRHALDRIRLAEERDRLYRDAEERGQAARVLGSVADGVFLVDSAGIIRLWNPAAETITLLPAEEMLGRSANDAIPGWAAVGKSIVVASTPAESGRATTVPVEIEGRELWLSIAGVGFDDGAVYAFRDLTEERHLDRLKTDFIATVSHELRTPIAAVHGAAKTLERPDIRLTEEARRDLLAIVSEQSERLVAIVDDVLLASQVEDQRLNFATEHVDVAELARRAIAAARTLAPYGITLELVAPRALPAVAADADKLAQVLANLIGNAMKYSPEGGRIELALEPRATDLCITVRDEGLGIAEPELDRIFEKFYRVDPNMTRGVSGSGLGLYISRELVRRMGGSISVESEVGRGSTFFVILPLAPPESTT